jgi:hypothetical protein
VGSLPGDSEAYGRFNIAIRADILTRFSRSKAVLDNLKPVSQSGERIVEGLAQESSTTDYDEDFRIRELDMEESDWQVDEWEKKLRVKDDFDLFYGGEEYIHKRNKKAEIAQELQNLADEVEGLDEGNRPRERLTSAMLLAPGFYKLPATGIPIVSRSWADWSSDEDDWFGEEVSYYSGGFEKQKPESAGPVPQPTLPVTMGSVSSASLPTPSAPTNTPDEDFLLGGSLQPRQQKSSTLEEETPSDSMILTGRRMMTASPTPSRSITSVSASKSLESATLVSPPGNQNVAPLAQSSKSSLKSFQTSKELMDGQPGETMQKQKASITRLRFTTQPDGKRLNLITTLSDKELLGYVSSLGREMGKRRASSLKSSETSRSPKGVPSGSGKESVRSPKSIGRPTELKTGSTITATPALRKKGRSKVKLQ